MAFDRELTPLEEALEHAAAEKAFSDAFYDVFLQSDLVVGVRGDDAAAGQSDDGAARELLVLVGEDNVPHLPVFASHAAMDSWEAAPGADRATVPASDLIARIDPNMRIMLNPGLGVAKVFDEAELKMLRRMIRKQARSSRKAARKTQKVSFAFVSKIPDEAHTRLAAAVSARRTLKAIYLIDVKDEKLPAGHYMLVLLDVRPADFTAAADRVIDIFAGLFKEGTPMEIGCLQDEPMWADIVTDRGVPPIYPKPH